MKKTIFRRLLPQEIDCRVSTINQKGCSILLYKDARVDQNILDETFGIFGWQRSHQLIGDRLYCTVSIWDDEKKAWISKQDVGTESYTEKEKGQASDSFKRACFNLGIGRELYTAPFIWIPADKVNITTRGDRYTTNDRFIVSEIGYDEAGSIDRLVVVKDRPREVGFTFGATAGEKAMATKNAKKITKKEAETLAKALTKEQTSWALSFFKVASLEELTGEQYGSLTRELDKRQKETTESNK